MKTYIDKLVEKVSKATTAVVLMSTKCRMCFCIL